MGSGSGEAAPELEDRAEFENRDLADQARSRAATAGLLGQLLLSEPTPDQADLVHGIAALEPLGRDDPELRSEYERVLLRGVAPYESVFSSEDGQVGGRAAAGVVDVYREHGFNRDAAARVASPDHLGLELQFFGHLCAEEAAGWGSGHPERAAQAVEAERELMQVHLGRWADVALAAISRRAAGSPYAGLADAASAFLVAETQRLRPSPDHPGMPPVVVASPPSRLGPAKLARYLLAPGSCGAYLDVEDLASAARSIGAPWRPSDTRSRFRQVVESAMDGGDLGPLLQALVPSLERELSDHVARAERMPGAERAWKAWRLSAEATLELLHRLSSGPARSPGPSGTVAGPGRPAVELPAVQVRLTVGTDAAEVVLEAVLEALAEIDLGPRVIVEAETPPAPLQMLARGRRSGESIAAGQPEEVLLLAPGMSGALWPDNGTTEERIWRYLASAGEVTGGSTCQVMVHAKLLDQGLLDQGLARPGIEVVVAGDPGALRPGEASSVPELRDRVEKQMAGIDPAKGRRAQVPPKGGSS
ncbi:MAG: TorD/DmsD family molecular chaperone [Acidimicrobiales bacterium]